MVISLRVVDLKLFESLTGRAFDRLNCQHSGEFDQNFSKKSNARRFARGGMGGFGIDLNIIPAVKQLSLNVPVTFTLNP